MIRSSTSWPTTFLVKNWCKRNQCKLSYNSPSSRTMTVMSNFKILKWLSYYIFGYDLFYRCCLSADNVSRIETSQFAICLTPLVYINWCLPFYKLISPMTSHWAQLLHKFYCVWCADNILKACCPSLRCILEDGSRSERHLSLMST